MLDLGADKEKLAPAKQQVLSRGEWKERMDLGGGGGGEFMVDTMSPRCPEDILRKMSGRLATSKERHAQLLWK